MDMQNVQVQPPSSKVASTASTATTTSPSTTSSDASTGTFVEALVKVIEGQASGEQIVEAQAEVSTDAAASIFAVILPPTIVNLITSQPADGDVKATVQALLNAIQAMDAEKLQSLVELPEIQQWIAKVEQLLTKEQNSTLNAVNFQEILTTTVVQPTELKSMPTSDLVGMLNRYLEQLESNPTNPVVQQLGSELKTLITKLSESFPALTAVVSTNGEASKVEGTKSDKPVTTTGTSNIQQSSSSSSTTQNSGDTLNQQEPKNSQSQLLQRLAYISHNVSKVVVDTNVSNGVETTAVQEATIVTTTDGIVTEHEDVTLTLTTLSDSQKVATTATEAKIATQSVSAQDFAEEMTRFLVKNMSITQLNGVSEAKISLVPEQLGQVDVRISVINGQITAHFIAESAQARDLIELQLPQLRASLQQQGLQVDKIDVEQQNNLGNSLFQDQRQQQTSSQQFAKNGKKNSRDYDQFGVDFSTEMDQAVRINRLAYGNTFNATA